MAGRVLIVEDNADLAELTGLSLRLDGWDVVIAGDAETAWLELCAQSFDAVVTDVETPRGSGIELLARLRSTLAFRDLPTVVTTAFPVRYERSAQLNGASAFMSKPYSLAGLSSTLSQLVSG